MRRKNGGRLLAAFLAAVALSGCTGRTAPTFPEQLPQVPAITEPTAPVTQTPTVSPTTLTTLPEPEPEEMVRVLDYIPGIIQELRYAGEQNFTGTVIYDFTDVYLRYGTVKKLKLVQEELESLQMGLKIWDGFRPVSAQFRLWEVCPNPTYVANPKTGYSSHSRGNTVDLTLVDALGNELELPTDFDDFSSRADRDYSDCTGAQAARAITLETVMERHGFQGYWGEWWHFSDTDTYEVDKAFTPPQRE